MRPQDEGTLAGSELYFCEVPQAARALFLYALSAGHYLCTQEYGVSRKRCDGYLLIHVLRGSLHCTRGDVAVEVAEKGFCLIDCCTPHAYAADGSCEFEWVHFDGPNARGMAERILRAEPIAVRSADRAARAISTIIEMLADARGAEDADIHRLLTDALTEFMARRRTDIVRERGGIDAVLDHMREDPAKPLTLEALAARANLSPYHFSRMFKRHTGATPHDMLIRLRLDLARRYLLNTDKSVKEISLSCGFNSECSFCTCFKSRVGCTPSEYRRRTRTAGK